MSSNSYFPGMILFLTLTFILESMARYLTPTGRGFTACLVHRDSPLSPLYDQPITATAQIEAAVNRSRYRLNYLLSKTISPKSLDNSVSLSPKLAHEGGEYIMTFYIGNPPMQVLGFADTSNGLIWVQCSHCNRCERDKRAEFDSSKSFTFEMEPCGSEFCNSLTGFRTCNSSDKWCNYRLEYEYNSATSGILSSDSFSFDTPDGKLVDVGFLYFGCSDAALTGGTQSYMGSVGLNQNPLSLISQLGIKKFSYCLVPFSLGSTSTMYFGSLPVLSGCQTPLLNGNLDAYYVKVIGISIGEDKSILEPAFDIYDVVDRWIIDSGTTYSSLETNIFDNLLAKIIRLTDLPRRKNDPKNRFELCFAASGGDLESFPEVTIHFEGADLVLEVDSTFVKILDDGVICLALLRSGSPVSILGNFQLQNVYVGYDLEARVVSFAPIDCAES